MAENPVFIMNILSHPSIAQRAPVTLRFWTLDEANELSGQCITRLHQAALKCASDEMGVKPWVVAAVVPANTVPGLFAEPPQQYTHLALVFLPNELADHAEVLAQQRFGCSCAWNISKTDYIPYFSWQLPGLSLKKDRFDNTLPSQLWIPMSGLDVALPCVCDDEAPKPMHIAFVTPQGVTLASHLVSHDDLGDLSVDWTIACRVSKHYFEMHTTEELEAAQEAAALVGDWPWFDGVWPMHFDVMDEVRRPSRNVIGGLVFRHPQLERTLKQTPCS